MIQLYSVCYVLSAWEFAIGCIWKPQDLRFWIKCFVSASQGNDSYSILFNFLILLLNMVLSYDDSGWWTPSYIVWNSKLRCSWGLPLTTSFLLIHMMSIDRSLIFVGFCRFLMTEATMEQQQTCGHVVLYSMSCLQVTCLSMILI